MQMHRRPVLERLRFACEELQADIEALRRCMDHRRDDPIAAMNMVDIRARQIQRAAFAGFRVRRGVAVFLDAAHTHFDAARREHQFVAGSDCAVEDRAGDDGTAASHGENAVDCIAKIAPRVLAAAMFPRSSGQDFAQLVDAVAADCRHRQHFDPGERRGREQCAHLGGHFIDALRWHAVGLGDDGDAAFDRQEVDDIEMLDSLRHDAVIGSHDQHDEIDPAYAGQHVAHEPLVSGDIDEADDVAVRGLAICKTEVDRNAARFFFGQAVGVDAGQRFDERGLAVVYVPCSGYYHAGKPIRRRVSVLPVRSTCCHCLPSARISRNSCTTPG